MTTHWIYQLVLSVKHVYICSSLSLNEKITLLLHKVDRSARLVEETSGVARAVGASWLNYCAYFQFISPPGNSPFHPDQQSTIQYIWHNLMSWKWSLLLRIIARIMALVSEFEARIIRLSPDLGILRARSSRQNVFIILSLHPVLFFCNYNATFCRTRSLISHCFAFTTCFLSRSSLPQFQIDTIS